MKKVLLILSLLILASFRSLAAPFVLPPAVTVSETAADGKGWQVSGTLSVSYVQAQARLTTSIAAAGWSHLHTINLSKDRQLDAWSRGSEELTLMVWRIAPGRSGFSYGVSKGGK